MATLTPREKFQKDLVERYTTDNKEEEEILRLFSVFERMEVDRHHKELYKDTEKDFERGLPQGLPTSPILTIASLQDSFINRSP